MAVHQVEDKYGISTVSPTPETEPRNLYIVGYPVTHSLSPVLQNTIFASLSPPLPWTFGLFETPSVEAFIPIMHDSSFVGASVTMPFKLAIRPYLDEVTEEGRIVGAINAIFVRLDPSTRKRRYFGTNTDCLGVRDAIIRNHPFMVQAAKGRPAVVLGAGGAARAAIYALVRLMDVSTVYMVNRDEAEVRALVEGFKESGLDTASLVHVRSVDEVQQLESPITIVGTVPNSTPVSEEEITVREIMKAFLKGREKGVLLDMCYHPLVTEVMQIATDEGWKVVSGTEAVIYQIPVANSLWTGRADSDDFPIQKLRDVLKKRLEDRSTHS